MNKEIVKGYMHANVEEHVDWKCLEVNMTTLAEDAAKYFAMATPTYGIPEDEENNWSEEDYFNLAYDVAWEWEDAHDGSE